MPTNTTLPTFAEILERAKAQSWGHEFNAEGFCLRCGERGRCGHECSCGMVDDGWPSHIPELWCSVRIAQAIQAAVKRSREDMPNEPDILTVADAALRQLNEAYRQGIPPQAPYDYDPHSCTSTLTAGKIERLAQAVIDYRERIAALEVQIRDLLKPIVDECLPRPPSPSGP